MKGSSAQKNLVRDAASIYKLPCLCPRAMTATTMPAAKLNNKTWPNPKLSRQALSNKIGTITFPELPAQVQRTEHFHYNPWTDWLRKEHSLYRVMGNFVPMKQLILATLSDLKVY